MDTEVERKLKLMHACCHPALGQQMRVALTLHTLGGLTAEEISRAMLIPEQSLIQQLAEAKARAVELNLSLEIPASFATERLDSVRTIIYLIFNEGYTATTGADLFRIGLCAEAIRLGRMLCALVPDEPECRALLALMLLQDSRRAARVDKAGQLVTLEEQDRSLWHREHIEEGTALADSAVRQCRGPYALQAAIAAVHARANTPAATEWREIEKLYGALLELSYSPVIYLNYAVAVAFSRGLEKGLGILDALSTTKELASYHLLPAARADILRRMGRLPQAASAYREALALVKNEAERSYLTRRLAQVSTP